jgi:hypothetical protein
MNRTELVRVNKAKYLAGRAVLRAEISRTLQEWWARQQTYATLTQLAEAVGVAYHSMKRYYSGRLLPTGEHAERLHQITGLPCLSPDHLDLPAAWVRQLRERADEYIDSLSPTKNTRRTFRKFFSRIAARLVQEGIQGPHAVTPQVLAVCSPKYQLPGKNRYALGFFGRFLLASGLWTDDQWRNFEDLLRGLFPPPSRIACPQKVPTVLLVKQLTVGCGLTTKEVRSITVDQIERDGIRLDESRLIQFGNGWHSVSRDALDEWMKVARPTRYLFYLMSPRDRTRAVGESWICKVNKALGVKTKCGRGARIEHFEQEFFQFASPRHFRIHLRSFHKLGNLRSWSLATSLARSTGSFNVPEPFVIASLCVARLLPARPKRMQGGKTCTYTWRSLFGRYEVSVVWPVNLSDKLGLKQVREKLSRVMWRLARDFWVERAKVRRSMRAKESVERKQLLDWLAGTSVEIKDAERGHSWQGTILERRASQPGRRKLALAMPLIEELEGGEVNGRCGLCCHLDRNRIDEELRKGLSAGGRIYGADKITHKFGVKYAHLAWHAGKLSQAVRYSLNGELRRRHERIRGHLSLSPPSELVSVPVRVVRSCGQLTESDMVFYSVWLIGKMKSKSDSACLSEGFLRNTLGMDVPGVLADVETRTLHELGLLETSRAQVKSPLFRVLPATP